MFTMGPAHDLRGSLRFFTDVVARGVVSKQDAAKLDLRPRKRASLCGRS